MLSFLKTKQGKIAFLGMIVLLSSYPYIFECLFPIPPIQITGPFFFLIFFIIYLSVPQKSTDIFPSFILISFIIQGFIWLFYSILHSDTTYITRIFYVLWTYIMIYVMVRYKAVATFVKYNNVFIAIQAGLSLVAFVLILSNILKPVLMYKLTNGQDGYCYLISCSNLAGDGFIRAAGYFDEPGALAFWGIYALVFNKLFYDNKNIEYVLLIGLFSTLSAAFFVQAFMYIVFFKITNIKKSIIPLLLMATIIGYGWTNFSDNDIVSKYTIERFQDGQIRSIRYELAEKAKKTFLENPVFGIGGKKLNEGEYMDDNQYEILAKDGVVGFIATYIPLFLVMIKCRRKEFILGAIIILAGYYQRPFHMNLIHFLNLYLFCILGFYKYSKVNYATVKQGNYNNNNSML